MAVATLERCYNNPKVFTGVVKIRKGETVRMIMLATNIDAVRAIFSHFLSKVRHTQSDVVSGGGGGGHGRGRGGGNLLLMVLKWLN